MSGNEHTTICILCGEIVEDGHCCEVMQHAQIVDSETTLLDPPYDGWAAWHEHAFPPSGDNIPMTDESEIDFDNRYDAVEDRRGRIFVWSVGRGTPVCVCADRDTAALIAKKLARE